MGYFEKIKQDGISLRAVQKCLFVLAAVLSVLLIHATIRSSASFRNLSEATDQFIELQAAAYELNEASDYLTAMTQRFAATANKEFMEKYFREAFGTRRREHAIETMRIASNNSPALNELEVAMDQSLKLMRREYYSMMLVISARDYKDYPDELKSIELSSYELSLTAEEKMKLAMQLVLDTEYYSRKETIQQHMENSLKQLEANTRDEQLRLASELERDLFIERVIIIIQAVSIMFMIWLTSKLGIHPVLKAVENIRDNNPLPVIGANEFRYLARTYNKMYEVYKKSVANLNYKASHDELTQLYNRSGYNLLLTSIDLKTTFMLLIDADNFKGINDNYGHEVGDKILQKIANTIKHNFRNDDYVCRIGGDEFVVFMVHADDEHKGLIGSKIDHINEELEDTSDGLPAITVSVGIAHGKDASTPETLFEHADEVLYQTKDNGRRGYTFYEV